MTSGNALATPSHNLPSWGLCECCTLVCLRVPETVETAQTNCDTKAIARAKYPPRIRKQKSFLSTLDLK